MSNNGSVILSLGTQGEDRLEISCSYFLLAKKAAAEKIDLLVLVTISGKGDDSCFPLLQIAQVED